MVIRTEDAQTMIAHGEKTNKIISVAFPGPFTREFSYIRDIIARGELGEIYLVNGVCAQNWLANVGGTWRTESGACRRRQPVRQRRAHVQRHAVPDRTSVTDVFAFIDNKDQEVDMIASVALRFTKGALGTATVSGDATVMEQGIYIQGTKGSIKTSIYGGELEHWNGKERVRYPVVPETKSLQQNFVDCIRGLDTTPSPPILGLRQARLMDAIYESARRGAPIRVVTDEE